MAALSLLSELITVAAAGYDEQSARRAGGRALFDYLGCRAQGQREGPAGIGDAAAAVFADLDDIHWPSMTHPGAIIWTAIADGRVSQELTWRAAHMGYEVTARLGRALGAEHRRHWHATTTAGTVGAAVAVASGTGADPQRAAAHAVSVAGGSILTILERTGTRMLHRDHAAATGVRCAALAHLSAAPDGLEHPRGMFAAMGGRSAELLGAEDAPALSAVSFRAHHTSGFAQAAVEAAAELAPVSPGADVALQVPEATLALAADPDPQDAEAAWWSVQHAVAATLLGRDLASTAVDDPELTALRARVRIGAGPQARVTVDGRSAQRERAAELSDAQLIDKWSRLNPELDPPLELLA